MLKKGDKAPDFTLPDATEKQHTLSDYVGKKVVLYFYPKDMTPGCTVEAEEFNAGIEDFIAQDAIVLGISPDSPARHTKFTEKYGLRFPLLADEDHSVAEKYGVWGEKKMMGRTYEGIHRTTFVIDEAGKILEVFEKVKPKGHATEVLKVVTL